MTDSESARADLREVAENLHAARTSVRATPQLNGSLSLGDGYTVQRHLTDLRVADGERQVGLKLGFTSRAKMIQMGVSDVIVGVLTDAMQIADGSSLELATLIHPRVEPEIAFRVGRDVDLADPVTALETAIEAVAPALEIIDSRYADFEFDLASVIADNTSGAAFVVGPWHAPDVDVSNLGVRLDVDGLPEEFGSTAAILGDPRRSLGELVRIGRQSGYRLKAGDVILAGAATAAVPLGKSTVTVSVSGLGRATLRAV